MPLFVTKSIKFRRRLIEHTFVDVNFNLSSKGCQALLPVLELFIVLLPFSLYYLFWLIYLHFPVRSGYYQLLATTDAGTTISPKQTSLA